MARPVVLGNGGLTVGLDEHGLVHDFYYPYVGLDNLTTARSKPHMLGVWVDGEFSWTNHKEWQINIEIEHNALVSLITMKNERLGIELFCKDFVDGTNDVFARDIEVKNLKRGSREVRIFFHQIFQISRSGRADTVMYVPDGNYILDYKGRCSLLAYAETDSYDGLDQYACGNAGIEGKEGTYKDAEDGELSMSAVEHGGVDSTFRVVVNVEGRKSRHVHYWLAAADSQQRLNELHALYRGEGFYQRMHATYQHWIAWFDTASEKIDSLPTHYAKALRVSMMVIKAHTDTHGGVIASCDSSIYNYGRDYYSYVWPRDGAWVMWPLIKLGFTTEPKKFFRFCQSIMHHDGYLLHKYQPDRAIGSTWHPLVHKQQKELAIQEDETAIVVWLLGEYQRYSQDEELVSELFPTLVRPAASFMARFIDVETGLPHASYDLWEEKFLTNVYTTAVTYQALLTAAEMAQHHGEQIDVDTWRAAAALLKKHAESFYSEQEQHLIKGFLYESNEAVKEDTILDISSFYGAWRWGYSTEEELSKTLHAIESDLLNSSPSGGTPRYEDDSYFKSDPPYRGNPWFVTTLWLAQYYAENNRQEDAAKLIDWSLEKAMSTGVLSEQIHPVDSSIVGVTPLVWSHAELINAILDVA